MNIQCFHKLTTDFITGSNPPYDRHDGYEIYLFIKGKTKMYIEQFCYKLAPGDMLIISPGALHRVIITDNTPYERIAINFTRQDLLSLSTDNTSLTDCFDRVFSQRSNIIHLSSYNLKKYINTADRYISYSNSNDYGSDLMGRCVFTELMVYTNRLYRELEVIHYDNIMPEIVLKTMQYIETNLTDELSLAALSSAIGYSPKYISSQFKRNTGLSLREYIFDKRIEHSKKLLMKGKSVSEASLMSGFNDYSNFIRSFTKKTGISPGHYMKNINLYH